jgi:beta-N-acetylhexosaminidase
MPAGQDNSTAGQQAGAFLIAGVPGPDVWSTDQVLEFLDEITPFGLILFARNAPDSESLRALTDAVSTHRPDLIVSIDHEGGRVDRLPPPFTRFPPMLELARMGDPGLLREVARCHGNELRAAGIRMDFAPVLDVFTNPDNTVIGDRAFGSTPEEVIHNALPYAQGLAEAGVLACGKHFPGHGDTLIDSHFDLPHVTHDRQRLRTLEMAPFAAAIRQGIPMIMTAHIVCESLDAEQPASLSRTIIQDHLRGALGFRGVVVSDDMEMKAIVDRYPMGDAVVRAVGAGSDLVLVCNTPEFVRQAHSGLSEAIESGRIGRATLADAQMRRKKLMARVRKLGRIRENPDLIGCDDHRALASRCCQNL